MNEMKQLIAKYATSGPRYTSYPTAPHFSTETDKDYLVNLATHGMSDLSLYLHVPFCRTLCNFCGCTTSVCTDSGKSDEYLDIVERELELWRLQGLPRKRVFQIHFGGGTPNFLSVEQILRTRRIFDKFFDIRDSDSEFEFSVELDPRTLTREKVEAFAKIGVTRASLGIQDIDPAVQKAVARVQPEQESLKCAEWLRGEGIDKINIDLMYGLPLQTPKSFRGALNFADILKPTRISLFGYAHVPWLKVAQKSLEKYGFPSPDERVEIFLEAKSHFESRGYEFIGLDHFALADDPLIEARKEGSLHRNFQGYTTHAGLDTFAVGLTSISDTRTSYRQNFKTMSEYVESVKSDKLPIERGIVLNDEDLLRRAVIMDVMCSTRVSFANYGVDFVKKFASQLESLKTFADDGLVEFTDYGFAVTSKGRVFLRNIAMLFDGRLTGASTRYSKTL